MIQVSMREWVVLTYIADHIRRNGYAPTSAEIATACGLCSRYAAQRTVRRLESAGLVRRAGWHQQRVITLRNVEVAVLP